MYDYDRPDYIAMPPWENPMNGNYMPEYMRGRYMDDMDDWMDVPAVTPPRQMPAGMAEALRIIEEAIRGEAEDRAFYEALLKMAASREDREIISNIRDNEIKHNRMFRELYRELTGRTAETAPPAAPQTIASYCHGLKKALMGEQGAVEKYRKILFAMQQRRHINTLTEIITDELRHLGLYNYLYAKNRCTV